MLLIFAFLATEEMAEKQLQNNSLCVIHMVSRIVCVEGVWVPLLPGKQTAVNECLLIKACLATYWDVREKRRKFTSLMSQIVSIFYRFQMCFL